MLLIQDPNCSQGMHLGAKSQVKHPHSATATHLYCPCPAVDVDMDVKHPHKFILFSAYRDAVPGQFATKLNDPLSVGNREAM